VAAHLSGELNKFLVQGFMVFDVVGVFFNAVNRTHFNALRRTVMAYAFGAQGRVDNINFLALGNRTVRALWLANVAIDAFLVNDKGHGGYS